MIDGQPTRNAPTTVAAPRITREQAECMQPVDHTFAQVTSGVVDGSMLPPSLSSNARPTRRSSRATRFGCPGLLRKASIRCVPADRPRAGLLETE